MDGTIVTFLEITSRGDISFYDPERDWEGEHSVHIIRHKAAKKLKGAQKGDKIRVEVDWSDDSTPYPVIDAERITGTLEERVEILEGKLMDLLNAIHTTRMRISDSPESQMISDEYLRLQEDRRAPRKLTLTEMKGKQ